ncbi:heme-binding domain-containing protein [Calycomorphotria hydatis]|uniref:Haem-binding domain-containing protein n=1 Tax=Calycomorphotria hydatis TaxID=2528027 RepID=A0A517T414_9PLAN|nr:heme-binding domain-containing protein [Calycomorphotria hydatis]QDT63117.1 hypothetical protein V22_03170 [Calycomorphotria hydatis]
MTSETQPKSSTVGVFFRRSLGILMIILVFAQLYRPAMTNPPVTSDFEAPPEVKEILVASCYDCHSHEVKWPWYSHFAPMSWLVAWDVDEGREYLNFSTVEDAWGDPSDPETALYIMDECIPQIHSGEMPPSIYTPLHPNAVITPEKKKILIDWYVSLGGEFEEEVIEEVIVEEIAEDDVESGSAVAQPAS